MKENKKGNSKKVDDYKKEDFFGSTNEKKPTKVIKKPIEDPLDDFTF